MKYLIFVLLFSVFGCIGDVQSSGEAQNKETFLNYCAAGQVDLFSGSFPDKVKGKEELAKKFKYFKKNTCEPSWPNFQKMISQMEDVKNENFKNSACISGMSGLYAIYNNGEKMNATVKEYMLSTCANLKSRDVEEFLGVEVL